MCLWMMVHRANVWHSHVIQEAQFQPSAAASVQLCIYRGRGEKKKKNRGYAEYLCTAFFFFSNTSVTVTVLYLCLLLQGASQSCESINWKRSHEWKYKYRYISMYVCMYVFMYIPTMIPLWIEARWRQQLLLESITSIGIGIFDG